MYKIIKAFIIDDQNSTIMSNQEKLIEDTNNETISVETTSSLNCTYKCFHKGKSNLCTNYLLTNN